MISNSISFIREGRVIKISNPDELKGMMDDSAYKKMLEEMS